MINTSSSEDLIKSCIETSETARLRGRPRNRWQDEVREMDEWLVEKSGRKKYMTGRNGRSS
jgi:hypothetical protein